MPEGDRLDRFLCDEGIDLGDRVAGRLVLLYTLPITRINRLCTADFEPTDDRLSVRISDDLVPVPASERRTTRTDHTLHLVSSRPLSSLRSGIKTNPDSQRDWIHNQGQVNSPRPMIRMRLLTIHACKLGGSNGHWLVCAEWLCRNNR
jgi:hypothetical protein